MRPVYQPLAKLLVRLKHELLTIEIVSYHQVGFMNAALLLGLVIEENILLRVGTTLILSGTTFCTRHTPALSPFWCLDLHVALMSLFTNHFHTIPTEHESASMLTLILALH